MKNCYIFLISILAISIIIYPLIGNYIREGLTNNTSSSTTTTSNEKNIVLYGPSNETATITNQNTVVTESLSGTKTTYTYKSISSSGVFSMKTFEDTNNNKAVVILNSSGPITLQIGNGNETNTAPIMYYPNSTTSPTKSSTVSTPASQNQDFNVFYSPQGDTARIINGNDTELLILTKKDTGDVEIFYMNPASSKSGSKQFIGPNSQVAIYKTENSTQNINVTYSNNTTVLFTLSNSPPPTSTSTSTSNNTTTSTTSQKTSQPEPMTTASTLYSSDETQTVYPLNTDNRYILKSSIVPPVCPKCPQPIIQVNDSNNNNSQSKNNSNSSSSHPFSNTSSSTQGNCSKQNSSDSNTPFFNQQTQQNKGSVTKNNHENTNKNINQTSVSNPMPYSSKYSGAGM